MIQQKLNEKLDKNIIKLDKMLAESSEKSIIETVPNKGGKDMARAYKDRVAIDIGEGEDKIQMTLSELERVSKKNLPSDATDVVINPQEGQEYYTDADGNIQSFSVR